MKNFIILLLVVAVGFLTFKTSQLRRELAERETQNQALSAENTRLTQATEQSRRALKEAQGAKEELHHQLDQRLSDERQKLQALQEQKRRLQEQLNDISSSGSLSSIDRQIHDKKDAIRELESDLGSNRGSEQLLARNGRIAKDYQKLNKAEALAAVDEKIQAQQAEIKATETELTDWRHSRDLYRQQRIDETQTRLKDQKAALAELRRQKELIQKNAQFQSIEIDSEVKLESSRIQTSKKEIQSQVQELKSQIKDLEAHRKSPQSAISSLKEQLSRLDLRIREQQQLIRDLESSARSR